MAPKQAEVMNKPHMASSSEEEKEESGSSQEESESSGDESDDHSKPIAAKKLEADSEDESDSDSDSDSDDKVKPIQANVKGNSDSDAKKKKPENTLATKPRPDITKSSSTAKRSLEQAEDEVKKKMKTSTVEQPATAEEVKKVSGDETKKQQMFQRLFSEADDIALLQGILEFTSIKGDPSEDMDAFCEFLNKLINFNATKSQLVTKVQRLKKKFRNTVKRSLKKGKSEDEIVFSKVFDQESFDLSTKIWGNNGVLASKSRKMIGGNQKEIKLSHSSKNEEELNVRLSYGREIVSFFKAENATSLGLDESTVSTRWEMVPGGLKREMEEKWKKMKATEVELCLLRIGFVNDIANVIFKDNASSLSK